METATSPIKFEEALKQLERIVADLEKGEAPLEAQLQSFEKGVSLSRDCLKRLEDMERRVEILVAGGEGKLATAPFETPE